MKKFPLLTLSVAAMLPGTVLADRVLVKALNFNNNGADWEITPSNSGAPLTFGLDGDPTNVGIANVSGLGHYNLIQQIAAPSGFTMSDIQVKAKGSGYSSWIMDGRLGFGKDYIPNALQQDYAISAAETNNGHVVVDTPLLLDASASPAYVNLPSIYVNVEIVKLLSVWTANNVRQIEVWATLLPNGTSYPSVWNVDNSGNWNSSTNWKFGALPSGIDSDVRFGDIITSTQTVYSNTGVTAGKLTFENMFTYVIAGGGSLTIQTSTGSGSVGVLTGHHKINLPLFFASNTNVAVASGATLTIGNPMTINAGKTVNASGAMIIQAPLIIEAGGSLALGPGAASIFSAPSLGAGAEIDVQGALTVDYRGQATPAGTIKSQLTSGYSNAAWTGEGINTSTSTAQIGLGWKDNTTTSSIQIKRAYYGDADLSGTVDSQDFNALVAGYGATGVWAQGDFNYDGKVTTVDFNHLAGNFGQTLSAAPLGAVVPEPTCMGLAAIAVGALSRRRRVVR